MKNQTERLVVGGVALLVGLLVGWMVRGVATYNAKGAMVTPYDDWRVACPAAEVKDAHCEMASDIIDKQQNSAIARFTVTADKDGKPMMGFMVPHGVALQAGMGLKIGKDAVKVYPYRTCNSTGCIATAPFDDTVSKSLKGADDAQVMFATLDGKPVAEPVSFKGYKAAYASWRASESKRNSWFWRLFS